MSRAGPALIALRNELYALMRRGLAERDPDLFKGIEKKIVLNPTAAPHEDFLRDKAPRYRAALKAWFGRRRPGSPFEDALAFSEILFNHQLFFDTHEYLEESWRKASGARKTCLQGLIQIGAGFHKLELDARAAAGALELLEKGLAKIGQSQSVLGKDVAESIARALAPALAALRAGGFRLEEAPRLSWSKRGPARSS